MALILAGLLACGAQPGGGTTPEGSRAPGVLGPLSSLERDVDRRPWRGTVEQRIDAGGYRYLQVGDRWVVTLAGASEAPSPGVTVSVRTIGRARDFASRRTGRTFVVLDFAVVERLDAGSAEVSPVERVEDGQIVPAGIVSDPVHEEAPRR